MLDPAGFRGLVERNALTPLWVPDASRRGRFSSILEQVAELLAGSSRRVLLAAFPGVVGEAMGELGWAWNGFYVPGEDGKLHLGPAFGPPVCTPIEPKGGLFTSGMCHDCLLANQTLAAFSVREWPGYVSCDAESGLATVAGIASPLRDPRGTPVAVWDLDSVRPIVTGDVRFVDVLLASLSRATAFGVEDFTG